MSNYTQHVLLSSYREIRNYLQFGMLEKTNIILLILVLLHLIKPGSLVVPKDLIQFTICQQFRLLISLHIDR